MAFASGLPDVTAILTSIGSALSLVSGQNGLISVMAALAGGFFVFQALTRAYKMGTPHGGGQEGPGYVVSPLIFGVLLINFWASQQSVADQLALSGGILSPQMPSAYTQQMWEAIRTVLHGFGVIAVFRGLLLAKAAGDGTARGHNNPAWAALWHVVGGVLLMRI